MYLNNILLVNKKFIFLQILYFDLLVSISELLDKNLTVTIKYNKKIIVFFVINSLKINLTWTVI